MLIFVTPNLWVKKIYITNQWEKNSMYAGKEWLKSNYSEILVFLGEKILTLDFV